MTELTTGFTQRLGIRYPIVQAPMAGVSSPAMAAAISNAGGLGSVAVGAMSSAQAAECLQAVAKKTNAAINVNVFCHRQPENHVEIESDWIAQLNKVVSTLVSSKVSDPISSLQDGYQTFDQRGELTDLLIDFNPKVVSCHFGMPSGATVARLKARGILLLATATSVAEAQFLVARGVDVLVGQGYEAGGHRGRFLFAEKDEQLATVDLVRQLVGLNAAPVLASGGIHHGSQITEFLSMGAVGVQLGTAFIGSTESLASELYKQALATAEVGMTERISGLPARGIVNALMRMAESLVGEIPDYPRTYEGTKQLLALVKAQKSKQPQDLSVMWAGTGVNHSRLDSAAGILSRLVTQAFSGQ